jgi:peptidoglycan/xylan/chitin deacetylase (PgdA/CDA1 family)
VMIRTAVLASAAIAALIMVAAAQAEDAPAKPVIILKLDDITRNGASGQNPISPRWQRCVDFLEKEQVKASLGIIGNSLEGDAPAYFKWIKDLAVKGAFEFWNHCYEDGADKFKGTPMEDQKAALEKTQNLAKEKLGLTLRAFGVHWSATDVATEAALAAIPDIKIVFFSPENPKGKQVCLKRTINLEQPTFVPNFEKVKDAFEKWGNKLPYIALQGHPNQWDDKRLEDFTKVVKYLKEQGCQFMTASEYVANQSQGGAK